MARMLKYEVPSGGTYFAMHALTDDGDHTQFNYIGGGYFISDFVDDEGKDYKPTVRVDGVISGGVVTVAATPADNTVDAAALACYIDGLDKTGASKLVAATDRVCARGAGAPTAFIINSITHTGAAWAVVTGVGHAAALDLAGGRGGAGEPPYIPVGSIEVAQVHYTSETAAPVTAAEIKQVPGVSQEMAKAPGYIIEFARVVNGSVDYPGVTMNVALRAIHTGDLAASVYMQGYSANFAEWLDANNVTFIGETVSGTSVATYSSIKTYGSASVSDGSFDWTPTSNNDDPQWAFISKGADAKLWMQLYETRTATGYLACQACISGVPASPESGAPTTSLTLSNGTKYLRIVG